MTSTRLWWIIFRLRSGRPPKNELETTRLRHPLVSDSGRVLPNSLLKTEGFDTPCCLKLVSSKPKATEAGSFPIYVV
jgi:hypothetical protein